MRTIELQRKHDLTLNEVEALREQYSGYFEVRTFREVEGRMEQLTDWERSWNIVTNEGLDSILDVHLSAATQITSWFVVLFTDAGTYTPAAGDTYAAPNYTEVTTADVAEAARQAWTDGGVASQSVDNSASPASYTADQAFTAQGAALVGGGTAASTLGNVLGGGTLYSTSNFGSTKSMSASDTIEITYTFTSADA